MDPPPQLPPSAPFAAIDSVESSPSSRIVETWNDEPLAPVPGAKLRLMCSYGGHIMPRPHDKSLCYVGGDTRMVVVDRNSTLKSFCSKLSRTLLNSRPFALKYQLPNEELDNLITVTTDEDLDNMIEEYDRVSAASSSSSLKPNSPPSRLRVFLFFTKPESSVSMGSLLDDAKSETWFVDALNNSGILTRGVSDSAAGDSFVNLDGNGGSGSSNNLEGQGADNNSKARNLQDVVSVNSMPVSPQIRVRVDDNVVGSRLQQEQQFAQMTVDGGGYVVVPSSSSAVAMPANPAVMTMATAAMVTTGVVSDDERSDPGGVPVGFRKPPLPLQLMQQPRTSGGGGVSLPSPDSVASDNSSIASTNSFSNKNVYYQEQQVQAQQPTHVIDNSNKSAALTNAMSEIQQIQDPGYNTLPPQILDHQNQQQLQQQQQFMHPSTQFIHHPAATGQVPVQSYYQVYPPQTQQQQQQQLHHQINQNHHQYPVYVMPYNMALQQQQQQPQGVANGSNTPPIYPNKPNTPQNPGFVQIPSSSNQFQQQQYVGLPQQLLQHHPPQPISVAAQSGGAAANYGYEYGGGHVQQDQGYYTTQQQSNVPLASQYQSMTPAAAAAALSDASKQFPNDNSNQQPNRTSQPV